MTDLMAHCLPPLSANPYAIGSNEHHQWTLGHINAEWIRRFHAGTLGPTADEQEQAARLRTAAGYRPDPVQAILDGGNPELDAILGPPKPCYAPGGYVKCQDASSYGIWQFDQEASETLTSTGWMADVMTWPKPHGLTVTGPPPVVDATSALQAKRRRTQKRSCIHSQPHHARCRKCGR